jgi:hypothetical protein
MLIMAAAPGFPAFFVLYTAAAAGSLSVVEVGPKRVKFAAGAYVGTLETPEQMAVFLYYLDVSGSLLFILLY